MAALLKLLTVRNSISGIGKRFYGIWSEDMRQGMEKVSVKFATNLKSAIIYEMKMYLKFAGNCSEDGKNCPTTG
jgi:hypothetical protein